MTRPGPSSICLKCWCEGATIVSDPTGYYNVPCLRHYDPDKDANKSTGPITKADLKCKPKRCPDCGLVEPLLYPCFASECPLRDTLESKP